MIYGNAEDFQTYLTERGFDVPVTWDEEKINAALLVASEWLDSQYEDVWIGYKNTYEQERSWPRKLAVMQYHPRYVYGVDEIPVEVIKATYEAAKRELTSQGSLSTDYTPTPYTNVSVYNAVTVEYVTGTSAGDVQIQIPIIQNLMSKLIDPNKTSGGNSLYGKAVRG